MLLPTAFIPIVWLGLGQLVDTEGTVIESYDYVIIGAGPLVAS